MPSLGLFNQYNTKEKYENLHGNRTAEMRVRSSLSFVLYLPRVLIGVSVDPNGACNYLAGPASRFQPRAGVWTGAVYET